MNILLVSEYYAPIIQGGGELSAKHLATELAKKHEVIVLTSHFSGLKRSEKIEGVRILRRLKTGKNPSSFMSNVKRIILFKSSLKRELKNILRDKNIDIVHFLNASFPTFPVKKATFGTINSYSSFCPKGNLFYKEKKICSGSRFKKCMNCISHSKYVGKFRMPWFLKYNPVFSFFLYLSYLPRKNSLCYINSFFSLSPFVEMTLKKYKKNSKSAIIPNIYRFPLYKIENKNKKHHFTFIFVGHLISIKGVDLLIKAFKKLDYNDSKLLIIGNGPEREKLQRLANKSVEFLGSLSNKETLNKVKQSDVMVLPSRWPEPLPRSLIEALHLSKAIITTDVGGNRECVREGKNGFIVAPQVHALKEKMEYFLKNKKKRKEFGKESKNLFNEKFSPNVVIKNIVDAYQNMR